MSGNTRKNQVTRLVTLRHRSIMSGALGFRATLHPVPFRECFAKAFNSRTKIQMGFGGGWGLDFPAPSSFYLPLLSCRSFYQDPASTANWAGFCDHHLDNLASQAQAAQLTDPAAARRRWAQVDRIATDQAPYVPVYNDASVGLVSFRVANYQASPLYGPCSTRCGSGSRQSRCLSLRVILRTLSVTEYGGGPAMRRARNRPTDRSVRPMRHGRGHGLG